MKSRTFLIVLLLLSGVLSPISVMAHPHNWIDLWVEARFDPEGRITGLHQRWLFDDYYSVFITDGMDEDGDGAPDQHRLDELRKTIFGNLVEHSFFTFADLEGKEVSCGSVREGALRMREHRVEMSFYIPFDTPHNPGSTPLTYRVFDPSFYIEMLHAEVKDAVVLHNAPEGCQYHIEPPSPDPAKIAYAASLPADADGGELGHFFAEKVTIKCPATL
jgi:ABC-type uncharacterized transport system substrate-binding protein